MCDVVVGVLLVINLCVDVGVVGVEFECVVEFFDCLCGLVLCYVYFGYVDVCLGLG